MKWLCLLLLLAGAGLSRLCASHDPLAPPWRGVWRRGTCRAPDASWWLRRQRHQPWTELAQRAQAETGVRLSFECPEELRTRYELHHDWAQIPEERRADAVILAWSQLRAYPPEALEEAVEELVLVRSLRTEEGAGMHGFASPRHRLSFLHERGLRDGLTVHHEIGHLLEARHLDSLERAKWRSENPAGFVYSHPRDTRGRLDHRLWQPEPEPGWLASGFLEGYATTAFEEDFATLFSWELACPGQLEREAESHPRLAGKRALVQDLLDDIGIPRD